MEQEQQQCKLHQKMRKMIGTIKQLYNRARQEVITTELIDIVGGSEALRK